MLSLLVLARWWSVDAPRLDADEGEAPNQRLTPTDAPRFKAGHWVDSEGRRLEPEVAP